MTVSSQTNVNTFPGPNSTPTYPLTFRFFNNSDVQVVLIDYNAMTAVQLVEGIDYTLKGAGLPEVNGQAQSVLTKTTPIGSGYSMVVSRIMPVTQQTDITNQGTFYPEIHENVFDRLTMIDQQIVQDIADKMGKTLGGIAWDALGLQIKNVGNPTAQADAVNLGSMQQYVTDQLSGAGGAVPLVFYPVPDGVLTTFSLPGITVSDPGAYTVTIDGIDQRPTIDYTINATGDSITFTEAPPVDTVVMVRVLGYARQISQGITYVYTIADLRTLLKTADQQLAETAGYFFRGDGGSGRYWLDLADTSSADNGGTVIVANDGGRWKLITDGSLNVRQFGARGDGATNDSAAIVAAAAASSALRIPAGTYLVNANTTIAEGCQITFHRGASFSVSAGATLTIRSRVDAGRAQIFAGAGVVLGLRRVLPEWFGATRVGPSHDDAPAIQAAINCLQGSDDSIGGDAVLEFSDGNYAIGTQLNVTPTNKFRIVIRGVGSSDGTYLQALATFSGTSVIRLVPAASNSSASSWLFETFRIVSQTAGSGPSRGITIGDSVSQTLQGGPAQESGVFRDINIYEIRNPWYVRNARLVKFERCSATIQTLSAARALSMVATSAGEFTGDLDFDECHFESQIAGTDVTYIEASSTGITSGIRFNGTVFYSGATTISILSGGRCSDFWWNPGCQFDVIKQRCFQVGCDGSGSKLYNMNIVSSYYAGALIGSTTVINVFTSNSGRIRGINVLGNFFTQSIGDIVYFNGTDISGIHVRDNQFCDANGGTAITIGSGVFDSIVDGNSVGRQGLLTTLAFLVVTLTGANRYAIRNNMGGGVTTTIVADNAAGANKIIDGNF